MGEIIEREQGAEGHFRSLLGAIRNRCCYLVLAVAGADLSSTTIASAGWSPTSITRDDAGNQLQPNDPKMKDYLESRVALVQEVLKHVDAKDRDMWYKQIFDNLSTLAQTADAPAVKTLSGLVSDEL